MIMLIESNLKSKKMCDKCGKRLNKRHYTCSICKMELSCKYMTHNCNERCIQNILNTKCLIEDD